MILQSRRESKFNEPAEPRTHSAAGPSGIRGGAGVQRQGRTPLQGGRGRARTGSTRRRLAMRRPGRDDERRHRRALRQETTKKWKCRRARRAAGEVAAASCGAPQQAVTGLLRARGSHSPPVRICRTVHRAMVRMRCQECAIQRKKEARTASHPNGTGRCRDSILVVQPSICRMGCLERTRHWAFRCDVFASHIVTESLSCVMQKQWMHRHLFTTIEGCQLHSSTPILISRSPRCGMYWRSTSGD